LQGGALGTLFVTRTRCRPLERTIVTRWSFVTCWCITTIGVHTAALGLQGGTLRTVSRRRYPLLTHWIIAPGWCIGAHKALLAHRIVTACWRIGAHKALLAHWIIAPYWCIGTHNAFGAGRGIGAAIATLGWARRKWRIAALIGARRGIGAGSAGIAGGKSRPPIGSGAVVWATAILHRWRITTVVAAIIVTAIIGRLLADGSTDIIASWLFVWFIFESRQGCQHIR
jgi:hypothetical protein